MNETKYADIDAASLRQLIRDGELNTTTAGMARGYVQANVVILPAAAATDFLRFCQSNSRPCPLLGVSETGDPHIPTLGENLDIRTDVPSYRVYRHGQLDTCLNDVSSLWRDDLVSFAIGCSFSFEHALMADGIALRHVELERIVSMYRTNINNVPSGPFGGKLVVSMRPLVPSDAIRAVQICTRFPLAHGAPLHLNFPNTIGIYDLYEPDYGDPVPIEEDELPVFWACGVTPQSALLNANLPFVITHDPGHMLVTDLTESKITLM